MPRQWVWRDEAATLDGRLVEEVEEAVGVPGRDEAERDGDLRRRRELTVAGRAIPRARRRRARACRRRPSRRSRRRARPSCATSCATSSHDASRDATGRLSDVSWCSLRDVENPIAPARIDSASWPRISFRSSSVACSVKARSPIAHVRSAECPMFAAKLMPFGRPSTASRYSGKRLEGPVDAGGQRRGVDVLGAFEVADDERPGVRADGRERETAVAHHHGGDAVPARVAARRVPEHLGVHVRVAVDEAGRDDVALGVDLPAPSLEDAADERDPVTHHADVGPERAEARAVDNRPVADDHVIGRHQVLSLMPRLSARNSMPRLSTVLCNTRVFSRRRVTAENAERGPWPARASTSTISSPARGSSPPRRPEGRPKHVTFLPDPDRRPRWCTLISVDDHLVEPPHLFEGRVPAEYADARAACRDRRRRHGVLAVRRQPPLQGRPQRGRGPAAGGAVVRPRPLRRDAHAARGTSTPACATWTSTASTRP